VRVRAGSTDQLFVDWGATGATLGVRVVDNEGATTIPRATGFVEFPAGSGLYYLDPFTFPDDAGSYTLLYDDDGGTAAVGHTASEELTVSSSIGEPFDGETYVDVDELFRILKIRNPSAEQTIAGERVLATATWEIDRQIDAPDDDPITGAEVSLAQVVCLERAVEHWRQQEAAFGLIAVDAIGGSPAERIARDTWDRHAYTLAPLQRQWGIA
jgi:hypothetical protein